jgi:predicted acyltransferase
VPWHGWTFADLIAPCFLWVIGVTTVLSLSRRLERSNSRSSVMGHVLSRAAMLYLVGMGLRILPILLPPMDFSLLGSLKFMGVLQRIAVCYLLGSAVFLTTSPRGRAIGAAMLLFSYWVLMAWYSSGVGAFESGTNFAQGLDHSILGIHGDRGSHSLLTIFPATATVLLGSVAGDVLNSKIPVNRKAGLLFWGGVFLLCAGRMLDLWVPINRWLWTPSYCLFTGGIAAAVFALFFRVMDVKKSRKGFGLLIAYGLNPIFLFVLSELGRMLGGAKGFPDTNGTWRSIWTMGWEVLGPVAGPKEASLLFGLTYTLLFGCLAVFMRRKGWIVKI